MFDIDRCVQQHRLVSDQVTAEEIKLVLNQLSRIIAAGVDGDVVEFGCYKGTTSLFLQRALQALAPQRKLYLYDSFSGLPTKTVEDQAGLGDEFKPGELCATKRELVDNFRRASLPLPTIKKAWFKDLRAEDLPSKIAFAYFDGDFYDSIKDSFHACANKLAGQASIVVDDYGNEHLPGARRAVDEWCSTNYKRVDSIRLQASLAIIKLN